jgi:hypothetical protein
MRKIYKRTQMKLHFVRITFHALFLVTALILPARLFGQIPSCPAGTVEPPNGLVAWWPLDEAAGATTLSDRGPSGANNATPVPPILSGAPVGGFVGNALRFGNNSYAKVVNTNFNFGKTTDFSIDAWIKGGTGPIVGNFDGSSKLGYSLYVNHNHQVVFQMGRGFQVMTFTGPALTPNDWYFVAVTVSRHAANSVTFYTGSNAPNLTPTAAGVLASNADASSTSPLMISKCTGNPNGCVTIDELEIFNRELSSTELGAIFNAKHKGKCLRNP